MIPTFALFFWLHCYLPIQARPIPWHEPPTLPRPIAGRLYERSAGGGI